MLNFYKRSDIEACCLLRRPDYLLHQSCYAVIEGMKIVGSRMMLSISNLTSAVFLLVERTWVPRGSHRSVIRKLRKTASNMIVDLTHWHWDWPIHWATTPPYWVYSGHISCFQPKRWHIWPHGNQISNLPSPMNSPVPKVLKLIARILHWWVRFFSTTMYVNKTVVLNVLWLKYYANEYIKT